MNSDFDMSMLDGNITNVMRQNYIQKKVAGAIFQVMRHGNVCYEHTEGYADIDTQKTIDSKSIFRIFSLTKNVTGVALMQLYERGLITPEDRLSDYFPAMDDMPVAVEQADGSVQYEKQRTPITIRHLYTFTSGISYHGNEDAGARSMQALFNRYGPCKPSSKQLMADLSSECALSFQPGTRWKYGFSYDVLGAVIEKITGMPYGEYLHKNIFEPLGMKDTGFFVPENHWERLVSAYTVENGQYRSMSNSIKYNKIYYSQPEFESGGGGLVSTVDDYTRFCQMLLAGGQYQGERILSRKTFEMLRTNQLNDQYLKTYSESNGFGFGYGIGIRIHMIPVTLNCSAGVLDGYGFMGTAMAVDPAEDMIILYFQNMPQYVTMGFKLMQIVYGSLL